MPFEKIQSEKLASAIVRQIEGLILRGVLRPGERLPAERDLAERLGVSRPSLREALGELEGKGLLELRPGAGVFVADVLGSAFSPALVRLFSEHDQALFDALDFRRDIEGLAAERAARLGAPSDLAVIDGIFARMGAEGAPEAELDAEFHLAIVEAGHNVVMLHMMRSMYDLLRQGVFHAHAVLFTLPETRRSIREQHRAINDAIQARQPAAARAALEAHIDFVAQAHRDHLRAEAKERAARQRLSRLGAS